MLTRRLGEIMKILALVSGLFLTIILTPPAQAACEVIVTFENTSDNTMIFLPQHAQTSTRAGTWRRMWRNETEVQVNPGSNLVMTYEAANCNFNVRRQWKFVMDREICVDQNRRRDDGESTVIVTNVYAGGGGIRLPRGPRAADPDETITVRYPASGFVQTNTMDPRYTTGVGNGRIRPDYLELTVDTLGAACMAAR